MRWRAVSLGAVWQTPGFARQ